MNLLRYNILNKKIIILTLNELPINLDNYYTLHIKNKLTNQNFISSYPISLLNFTLENLSFLYFSKAYPVNDIIIIKKLDNIFNIYKLNYQH